jgi:chromosomal replication initiator protein
VSPRVKSILQAVADEHGVSVSDLTGPRQGQWIAVPRFDAMARLRALHIAPGKHRFSLPMIGRFLGDRDHTTVIAGLRKAEKRFGPIAPIYPVYDFEETRI